MSVWAYGCIGRPVQCTGVYVCMGVWVNRTTGAVNGCMCVCVYGCMCVCVYGCIGRPVQCTGMYVYVCIGV